MLLNAEVIQASYIQRSYRRAVLMQRLSQRRTVVIQVIQAYLNFNFTLYIHINNHVHRAPPRHKKEIERETQIYKHNDNPHLQ